VIEPDPIYQNALVTQLINKILLNGKKALSERIVYRALEVISERTAGDPVVTLKRAVENARPLLETRSRRVGGASYQVPVEVRPPRGTTLALRWLVNYSRDRGETLSEFLDHAALGAGQLHRERHGTGVSQRRGMIDQQPHRLQQQIVKVKRVRPSQLFAVLLVNMRNALGLGVRRIEIDLLRIQHVVFGPRNMR